MAVIFQFFEHIVTAGIRQASFLLLLLLWLKKEATCYFAYIKLPLLFLYLYVI